MLVEVLDREEYIKRESGLLVKEEDLGSKGPMLVVVSLSPEAQEALPAVTVGNRIMTTDHHLFFFPEEDRKFALVNYQQVAGYEEL